jgi:trimethylamine:corrinoid methyltransferase-like protein
LDRFRREHYIPTIGDRDYYSAWARKGFKQIRDRANERAKEILGASRVESFDKDTESAVDSILNEAAKRVFPST